MMRNGPWLGKYTPAKNLAADLPNAHPDAPLMVDLGILGRRRVQGYVFAHGLGDVGILVESWREMRSRERAERKASDVEGES